MLGGMDGMITGGNIRLNLFIRIAAILAILQHLNKGLKMSDPDKFDSAGFADYLRDASILLAVAIAGLFVLYWFF